MGDQWERLKGKTYLDRLAEQLTALETDETLVSYKKQRERNQGIVSPLQLTRFC